MEITRTSLASGITRTLDLPVTQEGLDRWMGGEAIQKVFPHLTPDQREYIMTGITGEEWDEIFWQLEEYDDDDEVEEE